MSLSKIPQDRHTRNLKEEEIPSQTRDPQNPEGTRWNAKQHEYWTSHNIAPRSVPSTIQKQDPESKRTVPDHVGKTATKVHSHPKIRNSQGQIPHSPDRKLNKDSEELQPLLQMRSFVSARFLHGQPITTSHRALPKKNSQNLTPVP